jgi:hypothetical protein
MNGKWAWPMHPFTTRHQFIKMLEKIGQVIKQASMDELNNQLSQVEVLGTYTMQGT